MQKIWRQIGFTGENYHFLSDFMATEECKNESQAVETMILQLKNYRKVISLLESKIYQAEKKIIQEDKGKKIMESKREMNKE